MAVIPTLRTLLQMIRFSHTVFAMPFAIMGALLAGRAVGALPGVGQWCLLIACMMFARSAAMTFNRIVDRHLDACNPRTADRALPRGQLSLRAAVLFYLFCALLFVLATSLFAWSPLPWLGYGNPWPLRLALPTLVWISLYSVSKRFTWLSHFWLGSSLMLAPLGAWVAVAPPAAPLISLSPLLLSVAVLFWTAGFDILYACQDVSIDRRDGLFAVPARFGISGALWISRGCHTLALVCLAMLVWAAGLGPAFCVGWGLVAWLMVVEHWLVRGGRLQHVNHAFQTINGIISVVLMLALLVDMLLSHGSSLPALG